MHIGEWGQYYRENWERTFGPLRAERAAIIEFDGNLPRAEAERRALLEYPRFDGAKEKRPER
jgi:hypothetical protein